MSPRCPATPALPCPLSHCASHSVYVYTTTLSPCSLAAPSHSVYNTLHSVLSCVSSCRASAFVSLSHSPHHSHCRLSPCSLLHAHAPVPRHPLPPCLPPSLRRHLRRPLHCAPLSASASAPPSPSCLHSLPPPPPVDASVPSCPTLLPSAATAPAPPPPLLPHRAAAAAASPARRPHCPLPDPRARFPLLCRDDFRL